MTTLGVAMLAGTLTLAGLFLRAQEALLLTQDEIERLTPIAQATMQRRQKYLDIATDVLPWFVGVGVIAGLLLAIAGLFGWVKRQKISDALEDIAVEKCKAELRTMSDSERIQKAEQDALETIAEDAVPDSAAPHSDAPSTDATLSEGAATSNRLRARAAMNANMETELSVAAKLEAALQRSYTIDIGVEVKRQDQRYLLDIVARPASANGRWYVFEIKRIMSSFSKNYRHHITGAISQAVLGADMLERTPVTPVAIVVYNEATPSVIEKAWAYGEAFSQSFEKRPVFLLLSEDDVDELSPGALLARIRDSLPR